MRSQPSVWPPPGHPGRRFLILLVIVLGAMLVVTTVAMMLGSEDAVTVIKVIVITVLMAVVSLGGAWVVIGMFRRDHELLLIRDEVLAKWMLSPEEHREFLQSERRRARHDAILLGSIGATIGLATACVYPLFGIIMGGVFIGIALMVSYLNGLPPAATTEAGREVLVGWSGAQVLNVYRPFQGPQLRMMRIELAHEFPAVLRFHLLERHRPREVRVPVPSDRIPEAEALVQRFRDAGLLHGG